uniref:Gastrokine-1 n=1 Tax=Equus asinus asinus TaxID=83772 RepID=A0A8C4PJT6_EQUAS
HQTYLLIHLYYQNTFAKKCGIKSLSISYKFQNININDDGNSNGSGQQSVSVNNEHNVANVDNDNGWNSWNSIWDYNSNFAATRIFHKKACVVHRINKDVVPSLQALEALVKEKKLQGRGPGGPPPKSLIYSINPHKVSDLDQFGQSISGMCRGVPTYMAEEMEGPSLFFDLEVCFNANIFSILKISFCGEIA